MARFSRDDKGLTTLPVKYSYSGSDVRGHWVVNTPNGGFDSKQVESLSTVSVQVYEPVGRARALGFRGVKGYASSVREIAGTIVVTVIDDNPLKDLLLLHKDSNQKIHWSHDLANGFGQGNFTNLKDILDAGGTTHYEYANKIAPLIPSFNLFLEYVSEYYDKSEIDYKAITFKNNIAINEVSQNVNDSLLGGDIQYDRSKLTEKAKKRIDQEIITGANEIVISKEDFKKGQRKNWENALKTGSVDSYRATYSLGQANNVNDNKFNTIGLYIEGMKFISEGVVTSVNDMVTEISYQFIAQDFKPLSRYNRIANDFTTIENIILGQLKDPNQDLYKTLIELEQTGIDEHKVNLTYNSESEEYGITVEAGTNGRKDLTFMTKKEKRKRG